jgi:NAD(P)-dependent dehydrogenase (short-subunit alcohol dehydrogenase family)
MSADLGKYGIAVNAVSPAFTPTPGLYEHGIPKTVAVLEQAVQMRVIKRGRDARRHRWPCDVSLRRCSRFHYRTNHPCGSWSLASLNNGIFEPN